MSNTEEMIRRYEEQLARFEERLSRMESGLTPGLTPKQGDQRLGGTGSSIGLRLGVDVGGTFTDLLLLDEKNGLTYTAKVPSTPSDSSIGVLNGVEKICREANINTHDISEVMHGTGRIADCALICARRAWWMGYLEQNLTTRAA